jgi:hypothetical protein
MKLTHAIKNWLQKMFAWWPWKQSTQIEYSPYAINKGTTQETLSKSMTDGIAPQTGIVPSLSTTKEWPERVVQNDITAKNELTETPSKKSATPADETPAGVQTSPSTQQRLEFLQYLIKRGIVNEGVEDM